MSIADDIRASIEPMKRQTPEEFRASLRRAGIIDEEGQLTEKYRPSSGRRTRPEDCLSPAATGPGEGPIHFYKSGEKPHGCFSNFYRRSVLIDGLDWRTTEHYFQAQKYEDGTRCREAIWLAKTPSEAARLGRLRHVSIRPDWEDAKCGVMLTALFHKFRQHEDLREILLATGDATLVEHTKNDRYWGDGGDGSGLNMLGRLLMVVREALRHGR